MPTKTTPQTHEVLPDGTLLEMIPVRGGTFWMGSEENDREKPVHEVRVPDFHIGKYPVTVGAYMAFVKATGANYPEWLKEGSEYHIHTGSDDYYKQLGSALTNERHPIVGVSWEDAVAFCHWLSGETGKSYRLPSEAEWEYAARGGEESRGFRYAGSNKLKEVGWYNLNSHSETKPVGLKLPNELGIFDMSGNVLEWCADHWHDNYDGAPEDGSAWVTGGNAEARVIRGGSWIDFDDFCRVSDRNFWNTDFRLNVIGIRVARY